LRRTPVWESTATGAYITRVLEAGDQLCEIGLIECQAVITLTVRRDLLDPAHGIGVD
jgi:hypothetical protein